MRGKIKKAMVLAAGYGTRLKPLTDRLPKPLVPVAGKPMIQYALDKLQAYGIEEVVINVSHLKEQLTAWLAGCKNLTVRLSEETEPLETGGGLKKALPLLRNEPVFVVNSDIIWTDKGESALERLARHWDDAKMDFLLLVQPKAKAVGYDKGEDHLFVKHENTIDWNERDAPYIIAGIGIFHPRVLRNAPAGKFSVKILWHQALAQNRLFCLPHHGRWFQTGTLADIENFERQTVTRSGIVRHFLKLEAKRSVYSDRKDEILSWCNLSDDEVIVKAKDFAQLRNDTNPALVYTVGIKNDERYKKIAFWTRERIKCEEIYSLGISSQIRADLDATNGNLFEFARNHADKYSEFRPLEALCETCKVVILVAHCTSGKKGKYEAVDGAHRLVALCRAGIPEADAFVAHMK